MKSVEDSLLRDLELSNLNTLRVGGKARFFARPQMQDEIPELLNWAWKNGLPVAILGGGSNVLISDRGFEGLVIQTGGLSKIHFWEQSQDFYVCAQAGVKKAMLLKIYLEKKLPCAVFISGIPGEVGGGVIMNAGISHPIEFREFKDIVWLVKGFDLKGNFFQMSHSALTFEYRLTKGLPQGVLTEVVLKCPNMPDVDVPQQVQAYLRWRAQTQPLELPNCGSVFKNPPGQKAAYLIDQAGLKGYTMGGAQVSKKHANFIVNLGWAKAQDVKDLINYVQEVVYKRFQVVLEPEVRFFGHW